MKLPLWLQLTLASRMVINKQHIDSSTHFTAVPLISFYTINRRAISPVLVWYWYRQCKRIVWWTRNLVPNVAVTVTACKHQFYSAAAC
jgi:hypothetical protein